jgi:hypothetical protein
VASDLVDRFPALRADSFRITSQKDDKYNCVAWIARDTSKWWEPAVDGYYWPRNIDPDDLDPDDDLNEYMRTFSELGFVECGSGELEAGVEKIAIFASDSSFEHVAYQAPDGLWSSKLGILNDIRHNSPDDLVGPPPGAYANVTTFMARPRQPHDLADSATGLLLP